MEVKGKVFRNLEKETGVSKAGKEWQKQSIVLDTGDQFNPHVAISFFGEKTELLKDLQKGQEVTVSVNLSSREHDGKWYNSIDGWKIDNPLI